MCGREWDLRAVEFAALTIAEAAVFWAAKSETDAKLYSVLPAVTSVVPADPVTAQTEMRTSGGGGSA